MANRGWECLPTDPLLHVFGYLDFKDLIRCGKVCRRFDELCAEESLWKTQCSLYWHLDRCLPGLSWKETFRCQYSSFGRYKNYKKLVVAWQKLTQYLQDHCPRIAESIQEGVTEEILDDFERKTKRKLPDDIRCSYRIANGQSLSTPGLFGSMRISSHYRSECLLKFQSAFPSSPVIEELEINCFRLTMCVHTGLSQYVALDRNCGPEQGEIFYNTNHGEDMDLFISGKDFLSWFTEQVDLVTDEFPVIDGEPYRFFHNKESVAMTGPIKVSVATCFLPELSTIEQPHFFHTYRITMSMDEAAPANWSCQLETRHWVITDETEEEETVDGPGVVGEFPIMRPGASFSWISCTQFVTTYGNMKGHFVMRNLISGEYPILRPGTCYSYVSCTTFGTDAGKMAGIYNFRNLKNGEQIRVQCPVFHMKCLPYVTRALPEDDNR